MQRTKRGDVHPRRLGGSQPVAVVAAAAAALLCAACKRPAPPPASREPVRYEDSLFLFTSSEVVHVDPPGPLPSLRLKVAPEAAYATVGEVHFVADPLGDRKPVRATADEDARELEKDDGTLLGEVRGFPTANGSCFGYAAVHPPPACFTDDGASTSAPCYEADLVVHCESPKGGRYLLTANLGFVTTTSALTPAAAERAQAVERLLASLTFK